MKTVFELMQGNKKIHGRVGMFLNINLGKMSQRNVGFVPIRIANVSL